MVAIGSLYQVGMTGPVDLVHPVGMQVTLRQDRVVARRLVGPFWMITGEDHLTVPVACAPFGTHQVIDTISFVDMRCFNPDGLFGDINTTVHNDLIRAGDDLIHRHVIFPYLDHPVSFIKFLATVGCIVVNHIGFTVLIEEERGVDAAEIEFLHLAPSLERIFCFHHQIADVAGNLGGDHVKGIVIGIVLDRRGVDPRTDATIMNDQLRFPVEHMSQLLPVHQVVGVEDGYSGEHGKGGGYKKIIITLACDGGVRIAPLQDRIVKFIRLQRIFFIDRIFTLIDKLAENGLVGVNALLGIEAHHC